MVKINKYSKKNKVKNSLLSGNRITSMEAFNRFNVTRLSAIIFDLKKEGMKIKNLQKDWNTRYAIYEMENK